MNMNHQQHGTDPKTANERPTLEDTIALFLNIDERISTNGRVKKKKKQKAIKFPVKLMYLIDCGLYEDIICWCPSGRAFLINSPQNFERKVLPEIFKEAKYSSFEKKLKRWGFIKARTNRGTVSCCYGHPTHFCKGDYQLCMRMLCSGEGKKQTYIGVDDLLKNNTSRLLPRPDDPNHAIAGARLVTNTQEIANSRTSNMSTSNNIGVSINPNFTSVFLNDTTALAKTDNLDHTTIGALRFVTNTQELANSSLAPSRVGNLSTSDNIRNSISSIYGGVLPTASSDNLDHTTIGARRFVTNAQELPNSSLTPSRVGNLSTSNNIRNSISSISGGGVLPSSSSLPYMQYLINEQPLVDLQQASVLLGNKQHTENGVMSLTSTSAVESEHCNSLVDHFCKWKNPPEDRASFIIRSPSNFESGRYDNVLRANLKEDICCIE